MASYRDEMEALERQLEEYKRREKESLRREEEIRRSEEESKRFEEESRRREEESRKRHEETEKYIQALEEQSRRDRELTQMAHNETRPTTLDEYISGYHTRVFSNFAVRTNVELTTQRTTATNPRKIWCPTHLRPWTGFLERQRAVYSTLYVFPPHLQEFPPLSGVTGIGKLFSDKRVANEKMLEWFLDAGVEDPVSAITSRLKDIPEARESFNLGDGVVFDHTVHAISDGSKEVVHRTQNPSQSQPDQICVYRCEGEGRAMAYVCALKAPHKLTLQHLRRGLHPMDMYKDVVHRKTAPSEDDAEERFLCSAERLVASAVAQTYHYMVEDGLEYGLLTTGEAIVFLKVDWSEPETVLYHLAEPNAEVLAHPDQMQFCTAVGQYLAFTLAALSSLVDGQHGQGERHAVMRRLNTWSEDFETVRRSIPEGDRSALPSSEYQPEVYEDFDRSPCMLHKSKRQRRNSDGSRGNPTTQQKATAFGQPLAEYCTQKCLLGLVRGGLVDKACPNVAAHLGQTDSSRHPVTHGEFMSLLSKQLEQTLDDGITPLAAGGARGVLFKVTLLSLGYTFISKGTVRAFVSDMEHEAAVYGRLQAVQGVHVPVFLGAVDLRPMGKTYYFDHRVYVIHLSFMSWGGTRLPKGDGELRRQYGSKTATALRAIHNEGVAHRDVREANMLCNDETGGVMMIDFERALLLPRPLRMPLAPTASHNKRKRAGATGQKQQRDAASYLQEDTACLSAIFRPRGG